MIAITVIIPYYNEDYNILKNCVDSVLNQSFQDYEVIIVDDGSAIEKHQELLKLANADSRISVIRQNNGGVSAARNSGVRQAKGKYIVFIDSDDSVVPGFFEEAYRIAQNKDADIVYGFALRTTDEQVIPDWDDQPEVRFAEKDWLEQYTVGYMCVDKSPGGMKIFNRGPCARLIKTEVAKAIEFPVGVPLGEDVLWNLAVMQYTDKRYTVDQIWYKYIIRNQSATRKYDPNIENRVMPFYRLINQYFNDSKKMEAYYERVFIDLKKYIYDLYYGNKQNKNTFLQKWIAFAKLTRQSPWNELKDSSYFRIAAPKEKIRLIMFRMGLMYPVWKIINK